jgi:hypothetical protein
MIGQFLRPAPTWCALVIAGGLLGGCGVGGGATAATATVQSSAPITRAQATAYARAINLRPADVPELAGFSPEGEAPLPTRSDFEFTRCFGGVSPARRIAKLHSAEFGIKGGPAAKAQFEESRVEVWPTAGLAAGNDAASISSRGSACIAHSLEARDKRINRRRTGPAKHGRPTVTTVPNPLPGVSQSFLRTIAEPLIRGGRIRVQIYHDIFSFVSGPAEIELVATGFSHPVPAATEERLLSVLLARARSNTL